MLSGFLIVFFLPLSSLLTPNSLLIPARTVYDDFIDVLRTSEDCTNWYYFTIMELNSLNRTTYIQNIQTDLFKKYFDMRKDDLPDEVIEPILNIYCRAKSYVPIALNSWRPPSDVTGNFTWNLTDESPENNAYHLAKHKEKVHMYEFNLEKNMSKNRQILRSNSSYQDRDLRVMYRFAVFIITLSLALSVHNLLRMYYEDEGIEGLEEPERFGFLGETIQILVLLSSLIMLLTLLSYENE